RQQGRRRSGRQLDLTVERRVGLQRQCDVTGANVDCKRLARSVIDAKARTVGVNARAFEPPVLLGMAAQLSAGVGAPVQAQLPACTEPRLEPIQVGYPRMRDTE